MSTNARAPRAMTKLASAVEIGVVALSTLVAVGVSVLFLALTGASRTSSPPRHQSSPSAPVIQHYGTGAAGTATQIHTTAAHEPSTPWPWAGNPSSSKEEK